jgi:hypothetical protein
MATCFKCGAETDLYYLDSPICPRCFTIEDNERPPSGTGFIELVKSMALPEDLKRSG